MTYSIQPGPKMRELEAREGECWRLLNYNPTDVFVRGDVTAPPPDGWVLVKEQQHGDFRWGLFVRPPQ